MQISLTKAEYRAVNTLRGLPEEAHMMIMCSKPTEAGGVLQGSEEAFEALVLFIGEAMADGLLSATASRALWSMCVKINPDCADWLGM